MMKLNLFKFALRIMIFLMILGFYITNKPLFIEFINHRFLVELTKRGVTVLHVLWLVFMLMMLRHLFPKKIFTMALLKGESRTYVEQPGYQRSSLLEFVQDMNIKAWKVLLVWLSGNAVFGFLYLFKIIGNAELLLLTVFYFLCDYICIMLFCPFQTFIMKNRCCVNCRIYDWGHFMMFTPMLFIKNFFSWSLFFTSLIVLIRWELIYAKHPERFWSGSNQTIQCDKCKDKTCQIKKRVTNQLIR